MTELLSFDQLEAVQLTDRPDTVTIETDMWTGVRAIPVGYQHGFDDPATYMRAASYELIAAHRPLMVGVNRVTFVGFIYSKGAIGTRVGRHRWRVTINGRVSTLTLEATESRAEFEENCRRVIAFAETLAVENGQTSDWHVHGAWGRTGVVARARLTGFAELVVSTPETTITVQSQAVGAAVARNGFGSYIDYTGYSGHSPVGGPVEQSDLNVFLSGLSDSTEMQPQATRDPAVCVRRMDKCYTLIHRDFDRKENEVNEDNDMGLTLIVMLVSFLLTKSSTGDNKKALLAAGIAGAGTAYVTSSTDWGKGLNTSFNSAFGLDDSWSGFSGGTNNTTIPSTGGSTSSSGTTATGSNGPAPKNTGGFFSSLPTWLAGGAAAGATAWTLSSVPEWVWWLGGGILVWWLFFKD